MNGLPRFTLTRGDVVWADGQNSQPQPGRGQFVPRPAFPAAHVALSAWKALTAPRGVGAIPPTSPRACERRCGSAR